MPELPDILLYLDLLRELRLTSLTGPGTLGCFSVVRSASGTASACMGVSMSPGSSASSFTPCDDISSFQMRVMCASAALLEPYAPQRPYALIAASLALISTTLPRPSRAASPAKPS